MVLKLYNTLTRSLEDFVPLKTDSVTMYACGPTVYDYAHVGNWRAVVSYDLLRRVLQFNGFEVRQVMNITDVDDKTIAGSKTAGWPLKEFTKKYEEIFLADLAALNILPPTTLPHATEFIPEMITLVQKLLDSGHAYKSDDGVYFKIASFPKYGELSKQPIDENSERDFALWKFQTPEDGEVGWDASFGRGRPGWHIECSAMALKTLGDTIDIHTGGSDLIFPHHENEIAQSESATSQPFVKYWLHTAFLQVDGHKMSKSLNNFYTLKDLAEHNISPLAYRYWLLTSHYRSPVNFTWEALTAAQTRLTRLKNNLAALPDDGKVDQNLRAKVLEKINDDLNFPQALALIPDNDKAAWLEFDKIFGLDLAKTETIEIPPEVASLLAEREKARQAKDFPKADHFRQEIEALGWSVEDTAKGPAIHKLTTF